MSVRDCTIEVGEVIFSVRFELVAETSQAHIDPCDKCGENDPDVLTQVMTVSIFEVCKGGRKVPSDDAVYSVIKEIIESDTRAVSCERCLG